MLLFLCPAPLQVDVAYSCILEKHITHFAGIYSKRLIFAGKTHPDESMKYELKDIFEYSFIIIDLFAKRFGLTESQAYRYLKVHNGIGFIEQNYGILHTLDFPEVIEGLSLYCQKSGGKL